MSPLALNPLLALAAGGLGLSLESPGGPPAPLEVHSSVVCPAAGTVAERLPPLLRVRDDSRVPPHHAYLSATEGGVRIELRDDTGQAIAERVLPSQASCAAMADAAAVILASWQTPLQAGELPGDDEQNQEADIEDSTLTSSNQIASKGRSRVHYDVAVGPALVLGGSDSAAGLAVDFQLLDVPPLPNGFGFHLGGRFTQTRSLDVGGSGVAWRRTVAQLGPAYVRRWGRWQWASSVGLELGWLQAEGTGFSANLAGGRVSPGGHARTRLAYRIADQVALGLSAGLSAASTEHRLVVLGSAAEKAHRPIDFVLGLGLCVGRFH